MEIIGNTIQDVFLENIKSEKESGITFIESENTKEYLSYKKLYLEASYKLHALQREGLKPGDELIFQFQSNKNFLITFWACVLGKIIPVPIVLGTTSEIVNKITAVWLKLKNPYVITDAPFLETLIGKSYQKEDRISKEILSRFINYEQLNYSKKAAPTVGTSSDLVFVQFSSGSTGLPKGVTNKQDSILYNINMSLDKCNIHGQDRFLGWMPLTHDMGLIFFHILPLLANVDQFLIPPTLFLSNPGLWLKSLAEQQITISGSPNFGYVRVLESIGHMELEKLSFDALRIMINSAEPVSIEACRKFAETLEPYGFNKASISPAYGLAEAVLGVALYNEADGFKGHYLDRNKLNIGDKVRFLDSSAKKTASFADLGTYDRTQIKITNENGKRLTDDTLGIIHLKSPAITSGYYNDPETTQNLISQDGWLNTGDIGFIHEQRLVITGRKKEMIISNGQNYFPNDLDRLVEELPEVKFQQVASCNIFNEKEHRDELLVFVQYSGELDDFITLADSIKKTINKQTGITVRQIIAVERIPKTTSGKIQRFVLRDNYLNREYDKFINELEEAKLGSQIDSYVPPTTDLEKKLVKVWEDFFGFDRIGIEDNFFCLGGNSIGMGILASKIQETFGIQLEVRELFTRTNFKDQIELIKDSLGKAIVNVEPASIKPNYTLFRTQKRLFALNQINPQSTSYNIPVVLKVDGDLDVGLCEDVFKKIIDRHEILRTSFHVLDGEPVQKIHDHIDFNVKCIEVEEGNVQELLKKHTKPFDLSKPPLIRVLICKEKDGASKIILDIHHIVIDGASFDVLLHEFQLLYRKAPLKALSVQYKDFVECEERKLTKKQWNAQKEFWLQQYDEIPEAIKLPIDVRKTKAQGPKGDTITFEVDADKRKRLNQMCRQQKVTMSTMTLSILYVLLTKLTNQEDIVIGTSTLGRWQREFKDLIGLFINTLPLRANPKGEMGFVQFLNNVKMLVSNCLANEEYSFDGLLNDLELKVRPNDNPLFNVSFEYHNFKWSKIELPNVLLSRIDHPNLFSKFDLVLRVVEEEGNYKFNLDYHTDLFKRETVERFASYYVRVIDEILKDGDIPIKEIEVLSEKETVQLVNEFNDTTIHYEKNKTVLGTFSEQVELKSETTAIVFGGEKLTYRELDSKSGIWAGHLLKSKVKPGDIVALKMTRSIDVVVAMLSIMKAGATYLPVDINLPISRIIYMLEECNVNTILTNIQGKWDGLEPYSLINVLELREMENKGSMTVMPKPTPEHLMYIIYTSGSTGKPKGVMMGQNAVVNLVKGLWKQVYHLYNDKPLRIALLASHSFDASVQQIFGALLQGHSLYIADEETRRDGNKLLSFYNDNMIDVSDGTPTHLRFFIDALEKGVKLNSLSSWILAGEVLPKELVKQFYSKIGHATQLYNFYGPTEACVDSTGYKIDPRRLNQYESIPIGRPLPNERVYITNRYGQLMPLGTIGELCIAGDGLAQGYVGDKELTSNKFSSEWIPGEERVYRTGDMAKWLPDGNIVYHGRNDDHIKIRGFRIHLAEIEKALNSMSDIQQAVVKVSEDQKGAKKLIGYIVSKKEIDNKKIQEILEAELPEYMVPRLYIQLPSFPMTSNGKINKKLLTLPDTKDNFVAPMLQLEKQLALLWQEVLVVEQVGIYDNFYELGGDSIKAIQLASRCKTHGIHVRVKDIFNHQTISSIIFHLKNVDVALQETGFLSGKVTLHPVQKHFFERGYEAIDHYNQAILLKISKTITKEPLVFALTELVKQHDALRMQYCKEENLKYPMQEYGSLIPELFIEEITDLDDIPEICTKYQSDLDIFNGDLTRFVLFKTPEYESENRMLIAIHHLAVDGVSLRILTEDIISLVSDYLSGKTTVLPVKGTSYRQWNNKLSEYATTSILKKEYAYWKKVLSHFTPLPVDLSYDQPITYQETENVQVSLSSSLTHALIHEVNCTYGAEINDILTSALTMALSKWVTVSKVVIGMEGHGREELFKDMDVKRTVGWFTSIYPVCLNVGKVEDIGILIADTKDMLRGVPNRGIGYGVLRFGSDSTKIKSDLSVFYEDLIFNYLGSFDNSFSTEPESLGSLASETTGITIGRQNINPHRISIDSIIIDGRLYVDFNYDVKRYKKETLQKLADSYITALKNIISHSDQLNESDENHVENEDFEIFSL